jgi:hypothetical protein
VIITRLDKLFLSLIKTENMRTATEINTNFKIKVNGHNGDGRNMSKLVGVRGLLDLVGQEMAEKLIERAWNEGKDISICRLRRGLTIRFYAQ